MKNNFKRLNRDFYIVDAVSLAKKLLGKILVFKNKRYRIVEVESYTGVNDRASHSYSNLKSKRTEAMYLEGGHVYIYMLYGLYYGFNVVASISGDPQAVLIRAIEPLDYKEDKPTLNGPGKLCKQLGIDKTYYGLDLTLNNDLYITYDKYEFEMVESKRINIDYALEDKDKLWRFYIKNNKYVSKK